MPLPRNPVALENPPFRLVEPQKMRISVDSEDKGYATFMKHGGWGGGWKVYLNNIDIARDVIMADSELGRVEVLVRDKDGKPVFDKKAHKAVHVVKHGRVVIVPPPKPVAQKLISLCLKTPKDIS